ncbi:hypothetical protein JOC78_002141 [Bacillus ectoiniformans]|uniref:DUF2653 family protein n=1 Tax=Bacillus ectoiniformans TaxID=1494429 RepID=UPI00195D0FE3|nr:DUF2653 family protein [Bacillus ectoiniformans]MBM7649188.1 hypothetical protein [Bacillus ectoiniformans]
MEKLTASEQDLVNAICLYTADQKKISPEEVEVELIYDDEERDPFSAEVMIHGRKIEYNTRNIIEAVRFWLQSEMNRDPYSGIELILDDEEGIIASIN